MQYNEQEKIMLSGYIANLRKCGFTDDEIAEELSATYKEEDYANLGYPGFARSYFAKTRPYSVVVTLGEYEDANGESKRFMMLFDPEAQRDSGVADAVESAKRQYGLEAVFGLRCDHTEMPLPQSIVKKIIEDYENGGAARPGPQADEKQTPDDGLQA